jgi:hypothetical protein
MRLNASRACLASNQCGVPHSWRTHLKDQRVKEVADRAGISIATTKSRAPDWVLMIAAELLSFCHEEGGTKWIVPNNRLP